MRSFNFQRNPNGTISKHKPKYAHPETGELLPIEIIARQFGVKSSVAAAKIRAGKHPASPDSKWQIYKTKAAVKAKEAMTKMIAEMDTRKAAMT